MTNPRVGKRQSAALPPIARLEKAFYRNVEIMYCVDSIMEAE